jgi:hypothetical protein
LNLRQYPGTGTIILRLLKYCAIVGFDIIATKHWVQQSNLSYKCEF